MATMSVNMVGDNGAGYGKLGETLAKAIWGDPELEMNMALKRQDYETEAWRRKVMDAQAANQQSVAAKNEWELGLRQNSIEQLRDFQESLVEPPAPVEISTPQAPVLAVPAHKVKTSVVPLADITNPDAARALPQPVLGTEASTDIAGLPALAPVDPLLYDTPPPVVTTQPVTAEQLRQFELEKAARRAAVDQIVAGGGTANQVAQGLGIGEGIVKLESRDPTTRGEGEILYTGKAPEPGAAGKGAMEMRKEIAALPAYKDFADIQGVYSSMLKSAKTDTKAANMDLIYGIATLEDPGSVVRESDQIMVQKTGGLSGAVQAAISYFNEKGELTPPMKAALMQVAANRYSGYKGAFDEQMEQYRGRAERQGFDLRDVIPEFGDLSAEANALPPGVTEAMVAKTMASNPNYTREQAVILLLQRMTKDK